MQESCGVNIVCLLLCGPYSSWCHAAQERLARSKKFLRDIIDLLAATHNLLVELPSPQPTTPAGVTHEGMEQMRWSPAKPGNGQAAPVPDVGPDELYQFTDSDIRNLVLPKVQRYNGENPVLRVPDFKPESFSMELYTTVGLYVFRGLVRVSTLMVCFPSELLCYVR